MNSSIFKDHIEGVKRYSISKHNDKRGWLSELFRHDKTDEKFWPVMSYVSMTKPGIIRGPHEHIHQSDLFCFIGPSDFEVYLWDNRKESTTYGNKFKFIVGESLPVGVLVPPGVVHGYKNIGEKDGIVLNSPNKLYKGKDYSEEIDEIRHEADPDSPFKPW
jgi:dTDP-4-dehydrorhamnose 3,5-epimerase